LFYKNILDTEMRKIPRQNCTQKQTHSSEDSEIITFSGANLVFPFLLGQTFRLSF